jgi:hypothetical protein
VGGTGINDSESLYGAGRGGRKGEYRIRPYSVKKGSKRTISGPGAVE